VKLPVNVENFVHTDDILNAAAVLFDAHSMQMVKQGELTASLGREKFFNGFPCKLSQSRQQND